MMCGVMDTTGWAVLIQEPGKPEYIDVHTVSDFKKEAIQKWAGKCPDPMGVWRSYRRMGLVRAVRVSIRPLE